MDLLGDIERQAESGLTSSQFDSLVGYGRGLKQRLTAFATLFPAVRGRYPLLPLQEKTDCWQEEVANLGAGLGQLSQRCQELAVHGEVWNLFATRAEELQANFLYIAGTEQMGESGFIHWYERRERTISLSATPINVADELERNLYSSVQTCVMTSATLTTNGDFSYVRERLGIDESSETLRLHSPFDYSGRTLLYVPENGFPETTAKNYSHALCQRVYDLLKISRGRALVLFTSFKAMDMLADFLEDRLDYPVLVQGSASRQALLEQFRDNTDSVLLAVASFWEGVDVAGDSLSCVLIDKLPFEVPSDPVIQSRMKAIEEEGGNLFSVSGS